MRQIQATLMFAAIVVMASAVALATDYEFTDNGDDSDWNDPENWDPPDGPPYTGDTAEIPQGKTCEVTYYERCDEVYVYGTLKIISLLDNPFGTLILGSANDTESIVDGTIRFESIAGTPRLGIRKEPEWSSEVTISGSGTITASARDDCQPGEIVSVANPAQLVVDSVTVKGSVLVLVKIQNDGTFKVDHANDVLGIGGSYQAPAHVWVTGTGNFDVLGGTLQFGKCILKSNNYTTWTLTGGLIRVTNEIEIDPFTNKTGCNINVSDGTLHILHSFATTGDIGISGGIVDLDQNFSATGTLDFSGGTIELAQGKNATFDPN